MGKECPRPQGFQASCRFPKRAVDRSSESNPAAKDYWVEHLLGSEGDEEACGIRHIRKRISGAPKNSK